MIKNWLLTMAYTAIVSCVLATNTNAQVITAFSNDFEDGNLDAEVGSMTLVADSSIASVVPVSVAPDATLGNNVGLFDQNLIALDLTWNLTDSLSLADDNTVTIDFDCAARRTTGISRTIFVDAMDSNGNIVVRFVLGDSAIFGNGANDRQRPGYATAADGNLIFGTPPGSFWWGADASTADFDVIRDAHISLTIGASSFDLSTTRAAGLAYSATGLSNYDVAPSANIAEIKLSSFESAAGVVIYGMYFDNIKVEGVVADDPDVLLGDVNLDGIVNFLDISPFIGVLSGGGNQAEADCNESGEVDFLDISPFISILSGS